MIAFLDRFFAKHYTSVLHVSSPSGFHLRPAAAFATKAKRFQSTITAEYRGESVDAKKLNALLSLNLEEGDHFDLVCRGKDAKEAHEALTALFESLMHQEPQNTSQETSEPSHHQDYQSQSFCGRRIAPGIAIAPLWHYQEVRSVQQNDTTFQEAIAKSLEYLASTQDEIAQAHHALLATLSEGVADLSQLQNRIATEIAALEGGQMEAKRIDYLDILHLVEKQMGHSTTIPYPSTPFILVADELLPSQVAQLPTSLQGVVLQKSTPTSHSAILLNSAGIPSIICHQPLPQENPDNDALLDATAGCILPTPLPEDIALAKEAQQEARIQEKEAHKQRFAPVVTSQGEPVTILANVTDLSSAKEAKAQGAEGIGLLRTEFLFDQPTPPTFEQQCSIYHEIFSLFEHITIRTLDVGGDKALPYIALPQEQNPFLGIRGIRLLQTHPDLFETQLRAIFEAAQTKEHIKIMFPMIDTPQSFEEAKAFAKEVAQKYQYRIEHIAFGMMVEVPATLFCLDAFNRLVDFYSIGSNDLTQYLYAIERTHPSLTPPAPPEALYQALEQIAQQADKPLSLCGEMASDASEAAWLVAHGITTLSVAPSAIARIKEALRRA